MGICGADAGTIRRTLDRMASRIDCGGGLRTDRWEGDGLGLLRFHHGAINPDPQPVHGERGNLLLAMDGEVFDCAEKRRELQTAGHRFTREGDDAEFVLRLYEEKGERALADLTGSYSLLIYERPPRRLLLVTDRFFSRPIYYCLADGVLAFGSRFNALVAGTVRGGRLDMASVMQMFALQSPLHTRTHYREVKAMAPASVLSFQHGRVTTRKYWMLRYDARRAPLEEHVERLTDALRHSARRMTADGCRKCVMLSGGLDSRALAAATDGEMHAYTVGDSVNREVALAHRVARLKGWPHTFLRRTPDHYARMLDEAVELTGGMARFDDCQFLGLLGPVERDCDVIFIEEPMGTILKGIYWDRWISLRGTRVPLPIVKGASWEGIEEQILAVDVDSLMPARPWLLFRDPWRSRYRDIVRASVREVMDDRCLHNPRDAVEYVRGTASLGRLSAFANVTCVRPYLEYRSFCLDGDLLELAARMPVSCRANARALRRALKHLAPRLHAVPDANTGLRPDAPHALGWASLLCRETLRLVGRKLRLVPPTYTHESWPDRGELLRVPPLRPLLKKTLCSEDCFPPDVFDTGRLRQIYEEHVSRHRHYMRTLLCLLSFGRWFQNYGPSAV
jgi:hypothetical protein